MTEPEFAIDEPTEFFSSISTGSWEDPDDPDHRLARAIVQIIAFSLDHERSSEARDELLEAIEPLAAKCAATPKATRYRPQDHPSGRTVRPNATGMHPLAGPANAVAPSISLHREGDRAFGDVVYDLRFEGLPGLVQGGFIAAGFDLIVGQAVALAGSGGMTGSLSIRYETPTPLYEPLQYSSWFDRRDGRKTFGRAQLVVVETGRVCATAEGVFIAPRAATGADNERSAHGADNETE